MYYTVYHTVTRHADVITHAVHVLYNIKKVYIYNIPPPVARLVLNSQTFLTIILGLLHHPRPV